MSKKDKTKHNPWGLDGHTFCLHGLYIIGDRSGIDHSIFTISWGGSLGVLNFIKKGNRNAYTDRYYNKGLSGDYF